MGQAMISFNHGY